MHLVILLRSHPEVFIEVGKRFLSIDSAIDVEYVKL